MRTRGSIKRSDALRRFRRFAVSAPNRKAPLVIAVYVALSAVIFGERTRFATPPIATMAAPPSHSRIAATALLLFAALLPAFGNALHADDGYFDALEAPLRQTLLAGEAAVLPQRPDGKASGGLRYVTVAKLVRGSRDLIWEVINDKEDAARFMQGILESTVVESGPNTIVVDQRTEVGGPKGSYQYRLKHTLTPKRFALFDFLDGEIRDISGGWWIFDGPEAGAQLVVYSLHIDPGLFAPQAVVRRGQKISMPQAIKSIQDEVARRAQR